MVRHGIRTLLTLVCMIVLAAAVTDGRADGAQQLVLNSEMVLEIPDGEEVWLSYVPEKTGRYFFSTQMDNGKTCSLFLAETMEEIASEEDFECLDIWIPCFLTAGVEYIFVIHAYNDCQGSVKLKKDPLWAIPVGETNREVEYGARVVLEVEADTDTGNEITYLWSSISEEDYYEFLEEPLEGDSTAAQYVIESFASSPSFYFCDVSDGEQLETVEFRVWFDNHLHAEAENDTLCVYDGEPVVLKVIAGWDHGNVSYQWSCDEDGFEPYYDEELDEEIDNPFIEVLDEDGDELTVSEVPQCPSRRYYCTVTDDFGSSKTVQFLVRGDNGLTVTGKGEPAPGVPLHGDVTLEVEASANRGGWTYEWFTENEEEELDPIPGETTAKLVLSDVTGRGVYICVVRDDYGNEASSRFDVRISNGLEASPVGLTNRSVLWGGDVTLEVQASCSVGGYSVAWSEWSYDEDEEVEIGTGPSITLENVQYSREIICIVTDDYGNRVEIGFWIDVNVNIQPSTPTILRVAYGGRAELGVELAGNSEISLDEILFTWYCSENEDNWQEADNDNDDDWLPDYTTEPLIKNTYFKCKATYRNNVTGIITYEDVYFLVEVEEPDYTEYSHNLQMLVSSFGGIPSNPAELNYYYNVDSAIAKDYRVFRYFVIMNRDEMQQKLSGEPVVTIAPVSGTVPAHIETSQWGGSNTAYQLCVTQTPAREETAKYLVRCIWDTEMWEQEFTVHFIDLAGNPPEPIVFLGSGNHWTETVNRPVEMEKRFGFRNQWTPAAGAEMWVSVGIQPDDDLSFYDYVEYTQVSDVSRWFMTEPGIYRLHVMVTVGNLEFWEPATMYVLREDGTITDGNTLQLPSGLRSIEANAFENAGQEIVIIPDGCAAIGPRAFAASQNLKQVLLPASVTSIDPTAFADCGEVIALASADAASDAAADAAEEAGLTVLRR